MSLSHLTAWAIVSVATSLIISRIIHRGMTDARRFEDVEPGRVPR